MWAVAAVSVTAWLAVLVFVVTYVFIATEKLHRVVAAVGGASLMLMIGATDAEHALFSEESGIDWRVIFLLLGMMLIVSVMKRTGAFQYLAIWASKRVQGRPFRVMVILVVVTAVASAALDNVTTVLLIAPVTFLVCDRLGVLAAPFLIAEALASNIGGTATLVGDPPNIIIASRAGLTYNDFLIHLAPLVVLVMIVFVGLCRLLFRSAFRYDPDRAATIATLRERDTIRDPRFAGDQSGGAGRRDCRVRAAHGAALEPAVVALLGGLLLLVLSRLDAAAVAKDVEWPTLIFFAGLFVMVGALVNTGVIEMISKAATEAVDGNLLLASIGFLWGSALLSAIVDNIPYVATMSPSWRTWWLPMGPASLRCCGGPWRSGPIWAATPRPWARRPTWSCSAWPRVPASRSVSGPSPNMASWSRQ